VNGNGEAGLVRKWWDGGGDDDGKGGRWKWGGKQRWRMERLVELRDS
jgi:hypothetical protein